MVVHEYRVVLPFSMDEFKLGIRYLCARQKEEMLDSSNGEKVHCVERTPFTGVPHVVKTHGRVADRAGLTSSGTYIHNRLFLGSRFPAWVSYIVPNSAMYVREECWNSWPYSFTRYTSELFPTQLDYTIESLHVEGSDVENRDDVFADQTPAELKKRQIEILDIAKPAGSTGGVVQGDPLEYRSVKTGRGPLSGPNWWASSAWSGPKMSVYKRCQCHARFFPESVEHAILHSTVRDLGTHCFRNMFCWMDQWVELSTQSVDAWEKRTDAAGSAAFHTAVGNSAPPLEGLADFVGHGPAKGSPENPPNY